MASPKQIVAKFAATRKGKSTPMPAMSAKLKPQMGMMSSNHPTYK